MARANPNFKVIENEEPIDYTAELERMFSDTEDEADFFILVAKRFPKLSFEQSSTLRTLAVAFYRNGRGPIPRPPKSVKSEPDALERETLRHAKRLRSIARSQAELEIVEKRAMIRLSSEVTFHDLWKLGSTLGKEGDKRRVSEHTTTAERKKAGIEIG